MALQTYGDNVCSRPWGTSDQVCMCADNGSEDPHWKEQKFLNTVHVIQLGFSTLIISYNDSMIILI